MRTFKPDTDMTYVERLLLRKLGKKMLVRFPFAEFAIEIMDDVLCLEIGNVPGERYAEVLDFAEDIILAEKSPLAHRVAINAWSAGQWRQLPFAE